MAVHHRYYSIDGVGVVDGVIWVIYVEESVRFSCFSVPEGQTGGVLVQTVQMVGFGENQTNTEGLTIGGLQLCVSLWLGYSLRNNTLSMNKRSPLSNSSSTSFL